jgi:hypothetical protein
MGDIEVSSKLLAKLSWEPVVNWSPLILGYPHVERQIKKGTNEKQIIVNRWMDR